MTQKQELHIKINDLENNIEEKVKKLIEINSNIRRLERLLLDSKIELSLLNKE